MTLDELLEEGDLEQPTGHVLRTHYVGDVKLTSGALVARDPLAGGDAPAFHVTVRPGSYRATLRYLFSPKAPATYTFFDIVALVLRFEAGPCVRWSLAL